MGFCSVFFCRVSALKGSKGKDCEIPVPVGISITDENGKVIGECAAASELPTLIQKTVQ